MIVVDASAAIEALLGTPAAEPVKRRLLDDGASLHAPALIDLEVAQVIRRLVATGGLPPSRADAAVEHWTAFPVTRHGHAHLLRRVWELRENLTAYDAAYVALAEGLGATLLTRDKRLARIPGSRVTIEVL